MKLSKRNVHALSAIPIWLVGTSLAWFIFALATASIELVFLGQPVAVLQSIFSRSPIEDVILAVGVGLVQWALLSIWFERAWLWIPITFGGWIVGFLAAGFFKSTMLPSPTSFPEIVSEWGSVIITATAIGTAVGGSQWLILQRFAKWSGIWPIANAISFTLISFVRTEWWAAIGLQSFLDGINVELSGLARSQAWALHGSIGLFEGATVGLVTSVLLAIIIAEGRRREQVTAA
jgi:hypothetical protein